jgi:hypothetical protein
VDDVVVPAQQLDGLVVDVVGDGLLQGQDVTVRMDGGPRRRAS